MINGELSINDLSSKNRALLHRICADFGLEHYSTGSYNNRVFVIKDSQHTYFTQTQNDNYWENYLNNLVDDTNKPIVNYQYNQKDEYEEIDDEDEEYDEDDDEEIDEDEDEDDEEIDEEDDEEIDTDTYSSSSSSESSNNSSSNSISSISTNEYNLYLINKLNNQNMMLKYIYILSLGNLIVNTYLMFTI